MKVASNIYKANEVLKVVVTEERCGNEFLNWQIRPFNKYDKQQFTGAGLYGICYLNKLIYIGHFLGKRTDPYAGNIIGARWWAHFGTLTLRGHRLSIPETVLKQLLDHTAAVGSPALNSDLKKVLENSKRPEISNSRGCVTSLNRTLFANNHWTSFCAPEPMSVMDNFTFIYSKVVNCLNDKSTTEIRAAIRIAEREAIATSLPVANNEYQWTGNQKEINIDDAVILLEQSLTKTII